MRMMMQIRTITVGAREADVGRAAAAVQQARVRLEAAGYEVQMLRLALPRLPYMRIGLVEYAQQIERQAADAGFECVSLGPIDATRMPALPDALAATESVFASAAITRLDGEDCAEAASTVAETIVAIGAATPGGFGNM